MLEKSNVFVPPIKCQGIKTKLLPFIFSNVEWQESMQGRWVEPFMGSGVVAFNYLPKNALLCDTNKHIIEFYQNIATGHIAPAELRLFLKSEGQKLNDTDGAHYYEVRSRFNQFFSPLDFVFINRAGFNGLMRFNRKGHSNVPFCKKPNRFSQGYITRICNQVSELALRFKKINVEFKVQSWRETLNEVTPQDFVYLDPPYIGRHVDYFNSWNDKEATDLALETQKLKSRYLVSMWHSTSHRANSHLPECWPLHDIKLQDHAYHVGSHESLRQPVVEALIRSWKS